MVLNKHANFYFVSRCVGIYAMSFCMLNAYRQSCKKEVTYMAKQIAYFSKSDFIVYPQFT